MRTPSAVTLMSGIAGNGVPSTIRMLLQSYLVDVDWYCLLRISALTFASRWSFSFSFKGAIPLVYLQRDLIQDKTSSVWAGILDLVIR